MEDGKSNAITISDSVNKNREIIETKASLNIELVPWNPIYKLPMSRVASYLIPLQSSTVTTRTCKLIYQVSFTNGTKYITVRSNVLIRNLTNTPVEVNFNNVNEQIGNNNNNNNNNKQITFF